MRTVGLFRPSHLNVVCHTSSLYSKDLWLIHGLCESSESFEKIFSSSLVDEFNIYIPDLPGFGRTAYSTDYDDFESVSKLLQDCITEHSLSVGNEVYIASHSMGAIPAILACRELGSSVTMMINIEGTIVETPKRDSYRVEEFEEPEAFKIFIAGNFRNLVLQSKDNPRVFTLFSRYWRNIENCDARALMSWCRHTKRWTKGNQIGQIYLGLDCDTLFVCGSESFLVPEITFARENRCDILEIPRASHWMMLETPEVFYAELEGAICSSALQCKL